MNITSFFKINTKGFTLIELVISMAIVAILSSVLFSSYPESIVKIGIVNTSHKIALLVREAQVRGSAVDSKANTVSGYGVYVDLSSDDTKKKMILFSDFSTGGTIDSETGIFLGDGVYTGALENVSTLNFLQKIKISEFCLTKGIVKTCHTPNTDSFVISFTRPNPRPNIFKNNNTSINYDEACIEIEALNPSAVGHTRSIKVYNTGYITTLNTPC